MLLLPPRLSSRWCPRGLGCARRYAAMTANMGGPLFQIRSPLGVRRVDVAIRPMRPTRRAVCAFRHTYLT